MPVDLIVAALVSAYAVAAALVLGHVLAVAAKFARALRPPSKNGETRA
jgi:hypothetical protein